VAYEDTDVGVFQSQSQVIKLLNKNQVHSHSLEHRRLPKRQEGLTFQMDDPDTRHTFLVRILATPKNETEKEMRRIWRVLFYHIKTMFESMNSDVMTFREVFMPFVVVPSSGKTVAEEMEGKFLALGTPMPQLMPPKDKK
jgi:hypothetical protein